MAIFLEVAVSVNIDKTYVYSYPKELEIGTRVEVSFGNQVLIGIVLSKIEKTKFDFEIKQIIKPLDDKAFFSPNLIKLAYWIKNYYYANIGEVFKMMSPLAFSKTKKIIYQYKPNDNIEQNYNCILKRVFKDNFSLSLNDLRQRLNIDLIKKNKKNLFIKECLSNNLLQRKSQTTILNRKTYNKVKNKKIKIKKNNLKLNKEQLNAINTIKDNLYLNKPFLLQGVTGSGKTEVFLQIIENIILKDNLSQFIVMVPEISLTPQMKDVFSRRFGDIVGLVHSNLNDNERWKILEMFRTYEINILIGPRSIVFAYSDNLKLIVVDEEHDQSYKQNSSINYNGKNTAIIRSKIENIPIILSSATPSLESYYNAYNNKYMHIKMKKRVNNNILPEIKCVYSPFKSLNIGKLKDVLYDTNDQIQIIDQSIIEHLKKNLLEKKQSIILVGKKGYGNCLYSIKDKRAVSCPSCSISLTVHKNDPILKCHYCGYKRKINSNFDKMNNFIVLGIGIQKIKEYLEIKIPDAKIARIDSDLMYKKDYIVKLFKSFRRQNIDILIGTQVLAKGHDFPNVNLLIILEIDQTLHFPDFRAGENAFQLITQAAGRTGRSNSKGLVYLQTLNKDHPIIKLASNHDYDSFAKKELIFRKSFMYPPFYKLILFELKSKDFKILDNQSKKIKCWIENYIKNTKLKNSYIMGPNTPPLERLNAYFRKHIILSSSDIKELHKIAKDILKYTSDNNIKLKIDIDPQNIL